MKEEIKKIIEKAVKGLTKETLNFSIEIPNEKTHGDYSTNIAFVLAKKLGKNPWEVAELIKQKIELFSAQGANALGRSASGVGPASGWKKIEIAGPGFINFFIADKIFIDNLKQIDKNYGKGSGSKNKKIIIDYTDPNILKEFHVGHLMNNTIGESLSRIFEFQGSKVKRVCYQSDVGISVAKAVWGIIGMQDNDFLKTGQYSKFLGTAYAFGSQMYEEDEDIKKEIIVLNKKIFERSDKEVNKIYDQGKKWSLEYFDKIYKKLGTKFDELIFESDVADLGKKIVEKGLKDGIFKKGENNAIIFKGEKYGLHTRVFINSEGLPTYEAKDLGLAEIKYKKYKYNQSVIITGNEVNEYFKVMLRAMKEVSPELSERTKHIGHGMLRLPEGKMSSRTGKVITAESLIRKVEGLVGEKIKDRGLSDTERKEIIEKVAIGAIKYSILKQSIGSDVIYDFNKSISFEGDSGPYLQYSYTRANSVLAKAKKEGVKPSFKKVPTEIAQLEKSMNYFPEIVSKAGNSYEPHHLLLYLTELAGTFNGYYTKNKIVDKKDELSPYRIALTNAFATIMNNGMWMLGIKSLNKM